MKMKSSLVDLFKILNRTQTEELTLANLNEDKVSTYIEKEFLEKELLGLSQEKKERKLARNKELSK